MPEFASAKSFHRFERRVKEERRFFHGEEVRDFLNTVIETSHSRSENIKKSTVLCRAQRGHDWLTQNDVGPDGETVEYEIPDAFEPERMKPKPEFVLDGRVNPRGIPCLYLATDEDTAMAEVRPWVGSLISLGYFRLLRDVTVVDCSQDERRFTVWTMGNDQDVPAEERERAVWGDIGYAFSRPITPDRPPTEYVPTQILAEAFHAHGYDGVAYKSLLGKGHNLALFDLSAADLISCGLYETRSVSFKFEQCSNPYFIKKYLDEKKEQKRDGVDETSAQ